MPQWRESYKPARLLIMDARVTALVLLAMLHVRWYTVGPLVLICAVLWFIEKRLEMDVPSALRAIRSWMAGAQRPARPEQKRRGRVDYDRID